MPSAQVEVRRRSAARQRGHASSAGEDTDSDSSVVDDRVRPRKDAEDQKRKRSTGEMCRRTRVSFMIFGGFFGLVWLGHFWMFVAVLIAQAFLFRELINVRYHHTKELALPWFRTFHWCCFWSAAFWAHGENTLNFLITHGQARFRLPDFAMSVFTLLLREFRFFTFVLYATNLIFFVLSLKKGFYKYQMRQLGWTVFVLMLIVIQLSCISDNLFEGFYWFWLPASLVVCNDTFAYFSGKVCGRRFIKRPFLNVSPNKTWEGFIGALFFTVVWSQLFSWVLTQYDYMLCPISDLNCELPEYFIDRTYHVYLPRVVGDLVANATVPDDGDDLQTTFALYPLVQKPIQAHALALSLFASLVAPFGGFFASAIKRAFSIKDFDSVIPGHGGLMDRLDCQLIMAMYTRVHYVTWVRPFAVTVPALYSSFLKLPRDRQLQLFEQMRAALNLP